jgi:hypothetical protein
MVTGVPFFDSIFFMGAEKVFFKGIIFPTGCFADMISSGKRNLFLPCCARRIVERENEKIKSRNKRFILKGF